ncbi:S41 family peptidase [bacterium]|nr:S41 family peptidase [bacterium]
MNLKRTFTSLTTAIFLLTLTICPSAVLAEQQGEDAGSSHTAALAQAAPAKKSAETAAKKTGDKAKASQKELDEALRVMDEAMVLVKSEAREKPTPAKLVNGAIDGMTLLIEGEKLSSSFLKQVDIGADTKTANQALKTQFLEAAERYPQLMKDHKLTMAALKGILHGTDDPYTVYMTPDEYKNLNEQMSGGNFGGIGIVMEFKDIEEAKKNRGVLVIAKVMPNGPAAKAGLAAKDEITHVDGKPLFGLSLAECSKYLRGEANSKVVLTIRRPSSGHVFDVTLTREIIHVETSKSEVLEKDGVKIGYIYLGIFGESTNNDVEKAVRELSDKGCQAYIIDVRENSGGYVSAAVDVCSKFLPGGSRVVSIVDGADREQVIYSHPNLRKSSYPLAVLINANSASASEITAGAMQDHKRGQLIGVKSFGKGSVQKLYPKQFPPGKISAFKITTAHYHTPAGHDIHKAGLNPDIEVKMEPELMLEHEKDTQLQKALETLSSQLKEQSKASAASSADGSGCIAVKGFYQELEYLNKKYGGDYKIKSRSLGFEENKLIETVTVQDGKGSLETYKFHIKAD